MKTMQAKVRGQDVRKKHCGLSECEEKEKVDLNAISVYNAGESKLGQLNPKGCSGFDS